MRMYLPRNSAKSRKEGRPVPEGRTYQNVLAKRATLACLFSTLFFVLTAAVFGQDLPDKIRGYKVHSDKIVVSTVGNSVGPFDASVKIGDPKLVEAALTGVTFELPAEVRSAKQSGKVDFLAFHGVRVNGISVEVEEYRDSFEFRKGERALLPKPARIFLPVSGLVKAAWEEMRDSKPEWTVSGRVFVFGRFRRLGIYHKRVVPVDFEIKIKNPLKGA